MRRNWIPSHCLYGNGNILTSQASKCVTVNYISTILTPAQTTSFCKHNPESVKRLELTKPFLYYNLVFLLVYGDAWWCALYKISLQDIMTHEKMWLVAALCFLMHILILNESNILDHTNESALVVYTMPVCSQGEDSWWLNKYIDTNSSFMYNKCQGGWCSWLSQLSNTPVCTVGPQFKSGSAHFWFKTTVKTTVNSGGGPPFILHQSEKKDKCHVTMRAPYYPLAYSCFFEMSDCMSLVPISAAYSFVRRWSFETQRVTIKSEAFIHYYLLPWRPWVHTHKCPSASWSYA